VIRWKRSRCPTTSAPDLGTRDSGGGDDRGDPVPDNVDSDPGTRDSGGGDDTEYFDLRPGLTDCGPTTKGGQVLRFRSSGGQPGAPEPIATGLDFPTTVTVCLPAERTCPIPKPTKT
jgi:hypothetical protein